MPRTAQHTSGPWFTEVGKTSGTVNMVRGADRLMVAFVNQVHRKGPENDANANLIAAAPDLLKALKSFLDELDGWEHPNALYATAREAIRKAEGR